MKGLLALAVVVAVAVPVFAADHTADEAAILKVWQQFSDAWARGDSHARAALWSEDASLINPFGVTANGRAAIEKVFAGEDAGFAKGTTHTFSDFSFRFFTPALVGVDAAGVINGMRGADGTAMPPFHIHVFSVLKKTGGAWQIHDARPYVIATPPGQTAAAAK